MIERFNFFDIYGYLLPGGFLLVLLWLPLGLLLDKWPSADWGSAVIGIGLAYITGHILHIMSKSLVSTDFKDKCGGKRKPSDLLLDKDGDLQLPYRFPSPFKSNLKKRINDRFALDVDVETTICLSASERELKGLKQKEKEKALDAQELVKKKALEDEILKQKSLCDVRNTAFLQCRKYLLEQKAADYAEQMQGMYELLRGLAAALLLAFALYLGLGIGPILRSFSVPSEGVGVVFNCVLVGLIVIAVFAAASDFFSISENLPRLCVFFCFFGILFCIGAIGSNKNADIVLLRIATYLNHYKIGVMPCAAVFCLILFLLCAAASRSFSVTWAMTVYRDFDAISSTAAKPVVASSGPGKVV